MTSIEPASMCGRDLIFVSNMLAVGGAERVLCLLANELSAQGRRVGVLSFHRRDNEYWLDPSVAKLYSEVAAGSTLARLRRIRWIRDVIAENPNAVVIAFQYFVNIETVVACLGLKNSVVVSERNDPARVGNGFPQDIIRKLAYLKAKTLVCQTYEAADYFSDAIAKTVIPNPIDPNLPALARTPRRNTVITFCRLEPQKNLPLLIRAFKEFQTYHPEYSLEIYGEGSERAALFDLIDSLGLAGVATVNDARSDIHIVAKECAMFVLPSDYEGFSNSMIEAMALGVPTICTDCSGGGARMVIDNGRNGLLVPVGDVRALAKAMSRIAEDEEFAKRVAGAGAELRDELSVRTIAAQWDRLGREEARGVN